LKLKEVLITNILDFEFELLVLKPNYKVLFSIKFKYSFNFQSADNLEI